jgi:hypothetical protein
LGQWQSIQSKYLPVKGKKTQQEQHYPVFADYRLSTIVQNVYINIKCTKDLKNMFGKYRQNTKQKL